MSKGLFQYWLSLITEPVRVLLLPLISLVALANLLADSRGHSVGSEIKPSDLGQTSTQLGNPAPRARAELKLSRLCLRWALTLGPKFRLLHSHGGGGSSL